MRRQAVEHLFGQVIHDKAMAAGEGGDKAGVVGRSRMASAASCRPAIQPSVRASSAATRLGVSGSPITSVRNAAASSGVKAQVGRAQLGQSPRVPQPRQRQRWVGARGDHQVQLRWQMVEQKGERRVDGRRCRSGGSRPAPAPRRSAAG